MDRELPELVELSDYSGNVGDYIEGVYQCFLNTYIFGGKLFYHGLPVSLKRHPEFLGKNATFWHMTSEGEDEVGRTPDFRRCERIAWARYFIENAHLDCFKVWENDRGGDRRILIYHETESFLVVLARRSDYYMLVTSYLVEYENRKRKLLAEYAEYLKGAKS